MSGGRDWLLEAASSGVPEAAVRELAARAAVFVVRSAASALRLSESAIVTER